MEEMKKASEVMRQVLSAPPTSASISGIQSPAFAPAALRRGQPREC
jgi:hypothetical protein